MENKRKTYIPRILLLFAVAVSILLVNSACTTEREKEAKKNYVVGIINPHTEAIESGKGFIKKLAELGFVEGKNISYIKHQSKEGIDLLEKKLKVSASLIEVSAIN